MQVKFYLYKSSTGAYKAVQETGRWPFISKKVICISSAEEPCLREIEYLGKKNACRFTTWELKKSFNCYGRETTDYGW